MGFLFSVLAWFSVGEVRNYFRKKLILARQLSIFYFFASLITLKPIPFRTKIFIAPIFTYNKMKNRLRRV